MNGVFARISLERFGVESGRETKNTRNGDARQVEAQTDLLAQLQEI